MLPQLASIVGEMWHWISIRGALLTKDAVEIFIIFIFVYGFLRLMQGTRGAGVLRGLAVLVVSLAILVTLVTWTFKLETVTWVITRLMPVIIIPLFILFQPEVRRACIRIGQNPLMRMFFRSKTQFTEELVKAAFTMSRDKVGALIAIERQVGLSSYVEGGVSLDAEVTAEMIRTIFWPGSPLHDGAVIIRQERIAAAGCLFPLTDNPEFTRGFGTRHRAGIGVTEESDAMAIIISEETGRVSLAMKGALNEDIEERVLRKALEEIAVEAPQE